MGGSTLRLLALSLVRAAVSMLGAYLVRWGFVDHTLMEDAASAVAFLIVDRAWELYQRHREELHRALYQRWLVIIGLRERASHDPERQALQAEYITNEARARASAGMQP
jgi:hypothetical protein